LQHLVAVFQDPEIKRTYKLYATGHSLGGALATLFSFYVSAYSLQEGKDESLIPAPISCISIASPRVGEGSFQASFELLERKRKLRHLRIYNENDPVPMMPKTSGKMIWAMLSPISYLAFKVIDNQFETKETFQHTGINLKLRKQGEKELFEISYSEKLKSKEEESAGKEKNSFDQKKVPDVVEHMGTAYCDNLRNVKNELKNKRMKLDELYTYHATSMVET